LTEIDSLHLEVEVLHQFDEDVLVVGDGDRVWFIEIGPDLDSVAVGLRLFWWDEAETVHFLASLEGLPDQLECEGLVDLFFVGLGLWHLKNEPSSILILLIFPLGLDPFPEELNRVDFPVGAVDFVAA
jgi:hypothetical protein